MTRLSEKITEYYCFHRKSAFQSRGISEQERESFCTKLQQVRQIRNFAVHRVMLKADTIRRYAKITIDVLVFTQRLGNSEYQALFTGPVSKSPYTPQVNNLGLTELKLNRFIETFWEASDSYQPEMIFQNYQATETSKTSEENFSNMEKRESNLNTTIEAQQIAAQRKASNVKKMIEAFENSKKSKMSRQDRAEREKEVAQLRMAERAERRRKQEEDAAVRRAQRAEKAEIQGEKPKVKL